jgi:hypothetical protein
MKTPIHSRSRCIGAALLLAATSAMAQPQDAPADCAVRIASGPVGKVYELMFKDMQTVCGAAVSMCAVASSGGLQNLNALSSSQAELGMVQVDTLRDMQGDDNIRALQAVMPLHVNLLHVISLVDGTKVDRSTVFGVPVPATGRVVQVRKFSELKGLDVAVVGSAQLMGQALEKQLRYGMRFIVADNDDHALKLLRSEQVQAVFTLGGWPLPSVARHKYGSGLLLAEYDLEPQRPYMVVKRSYQDLDAFNRSFLAVPNLLVTRPFRVGGAANQRVAALQACLTQHLDELQEGHYQPTWKEIRELGELHGVAAFAGAKSDRTTSSRRRQ